MKRNLSIAGMLFISLLCVGQPQWENFNTGNSGLLSNTLSSITINEESHIWAAYTGVGGTGLGVVKYDGVTWTIYNSGNSGLPNNDIRAIASDGAGNMWFGTYQGGVAKFNGSTWTVYNTGNSGLPDNTVTAVRIANNADVWIGTYQGGVTRFAGGTWTTFNHSNAPFPENNCVNDVAVDGDFNVWVGFDCQGGMAKRDASGVWTSYTTANSNLAHHTVTAVKPNGDGTVWVGYLSNIISRFNSTDNTWKHYDLPAGTSTAFRSFTMDQFGHSWVGTMGSGLMRFGNTGWVKVVIPGAGNLNSNFSQSVVRDGHGNLWWGEMNGGLWKRSLPEFFMIPDANFRNCLKETYPFAFTGDDKLIVALAQNITHVNCDFRSITDLTGLAYLGGLQEFSVDVNQIPSFPDVSSLASLRILSFGTNGMTTFPDLSQNTNLESIAAYSNNFSTFPDLTNNRNLLYIDLMGNPITSVPDLFFLPKLTTLGLSHTLITELPDLTYNPKLRWLWFRDVNLPSAPDLTMLPDLESLDIRYNNFTDFPAISTNNFTQVWASGNNFTDLPDFSGMPLGDPYSYLHLANNMLTFEDLLPFTNKNFEELELVPQKIVTADADTATVDSQPYTLKLPFDDEVTTNTYSWYKDNVFLSTTTVNELVIEQVAASDAGVYFAEVTNPAIPGLTLKTGNTTLSVLNGVFWITDNNFRQCLKETYPSIFESHDYVIASEAANITQITCNTRNIADLAGIEGFTNLVDIHVQSNRLTEIDEVSSLTHLQDLDVAHNDIASTPDLSGLADLLYINFSDNLITTFPDISQCPDMEWIVVEQNKLTSISNLSHLANLGILNVGKNPITALPALATNTKLFYLRFDSTKISTFPDLSANVLLERLYFGGNPQFSTWPDLTTNVNLKYIACDGNGLTSIPDLTFHPLLLVLACSYNNLTSLPDLTAQTQMTALLADHNALTSLPDLSHTKIVLAANASLRLEHNHLSFGDLLPLVTLTHYASLSYAPQTLPIENNVINKFTGETFTLNIGIDDNISGVKFEWFKGDQFLFQTNTAGFTKSNLTPSDSGRYHCMISHTQAPLLALKWEAARLTISEHVKKFWIADAGLRRCIKESYPEIFDAEEFVSETLAKNIMSIQCYAREITDLSGVENFVNLTSLAIGSCKLTDINEIASMISLKMIDFPNNAITGLPDFSALENLETINLARNTISNPPSLTNNTKISWLDLNNNNLTSVGSIGHLTGLKTLAIGFNPITHLPSMSPFKELTLLNISEIRDEAFPDLSQNTKLTSLAFARNPQFSQWPDIRGNKALQYLTCDGNRISSVPDLSLYKDLRYLEISDNNLAALPDFSGLIHMDVLLANHNRLTSLPDLRQTKIGTTPNSMLGVSHNSLSFEDIVPAISGRTFARLDYNSQTLPQEDISINKNVGETLLLAIGIDHGLNDNTFTWFKDNSQIAVTTTDELTIENITESKAGVYHCEITNTAAPGLTLTWREAKLLIADPCLQVSIDSYRVQVTSASCIAGGKIAIRKGGALADMVTGLEVQEILTGNSTTSDNQEVVELATGTYNVTATINGCKIEWPDIFEIIKDESCDHPVISPNNDGQAEDFYIPHQGTAKIYNRNGQIVNEFPVPSSWSGTDRTGAPLPMGLYIIVCDGYKEISITVVR